MCDVAAPSSLYLTIALARPPTADIIDDRTCSPIGCPVDDEHHQSYEGLQFSYGKHYNQSPPHSLPTDISDRLRFQIRQPLP